MPGPYRLVTPEVADSSTPLPFRACLRPPPHFLDVPPGVPLPEPDQLLGEAHATSSVFVHHRGVLRIRLGHPTGKGIPHLSRLSTVLFTDTVGSSKRAASLGDRAWRRLLEKHHALVRNQLVRFRGREMDAAGDGFFASFDGPARAIRCASAIVGEVRELQLEVRAGLHTGECEVIDGKVAGIAVHTGARIASLAAPGEVLVSSTVKDLVVGSGIDFDDRGVHELKGVPGTWRLYGVVG